MKIRIYAKNIYLQYIAIVLSIGLIAYLSPPIGIVALYLCIICFAIKSNYKTLAFFVCFCLLQNIILILFANRITGRWTTLFLLSKEILAYIVAIPYMVKKTRASILSCGIALFILLLLVEFIVSPAPVFSRILSIRQFMLPFICFFFGSSLRISEKETDSIMDFIIKASILIAIIGLIESFILPDFWLKVPMKQFQINKGTTFSFYCGVPLNFYTWDLYPFIGTVARRMVSIFGDPIITGHYLLLGFVFSDVRIKEKWKKDIVKLFLLIASVMTLCKGAIIGFIIYYIYKLFKKFSYPDIKKLIIIGIIAIVPIYYIVYYLVSKYASMSSIMIHLNSLQKGLNNSGILGNGLGVAGAVTSVVSSNTDESITGDSYIGVLGAQMGIVGIILYLLIWIYVGIKLLYLYKVNNDKLYLLASFLLITLLIESFFAESAIGIVGTGMYFITAGIMYKRKNRHQEYIYKSYVTNNMETI